MGDTLLAVDRRDTLVVGPLVVRLDRVSTHHPVGGRARVVRGRGVVDPLEGRRVGGVPPHPPAAAEGGRVRGRPDILRLGGLLGRGRVPLVAVGDILLRVVLQGRVRVVQGVVGGILLVRLPVVDHLDTLLVEDPLDMLLVVEDPLDILQALLDTLLGVDLLDNHPLAVDPLVVAVGTLRQVAGGDTGTQKRVHRYHPSEVL